MSMIASSRERRRSACPPSRRSFGFIVPSGPTEGITTRDSMESSKANCKPLGRQSPKACNLKTPLVRKNDSRSKAWKFFTDDEMADDRLDGRAAAHLSLDLRGHPPLLTRD